jgi:hypothetical protein
MRFFISNTKIIWHQNPRGSRQVPSGILTEPAALIERVFINGKIKKKIKLSLTNQWSNQG